MRISNLDEHPAKQVNGTGILLAMRDLGKPVYAGTASPKAVARRRARNKAAAATRRGQRR